MYLIHPNKKQYKANLHCHSTDDNHNGFPVGSPMCDSFGAFTMIMPESFTYESIISADFEIDPRAEYIRISIVDKYGNFADTRGYFKDELL